jgi:hypothetical protein
MITLAPASTRPIRITVPAKRGIVVEKVNANLPAPAIRLLAGPVGGAGPIGPTGPAGNNGADLNGYDPGDINLIFENNLI